MSTPAEIRSAALDLMKASPRRASEAKARWGEIIRSCPEGPGPEEPWLSLLLEMAHGLNDPRKCLQALPIAARVLGEAGLPLNAAGPKGLNAFDLALRKAMARKGDLVAWLSVLTHLTRLGCRQTPGMRILAKAIKECHPTPLIQVLLESGSTAHEPYGSGVSCFQAVLSVHTMYLSIPMACWIKAGLDAADPRVRQRTAERLVDLLQPRSSMTHEYLDAMGDLLSWGQVDWSATPHAGLPPAPLATRLSAALVSIDLTPEERTPHHRALSTLQARLLEANLPLPAAVSDSPGRVRARL